ncbi:hypothetical protein L1987_01858 [Smallanthus sonchifolius]|uniref:Uncharacterized protein n=1 Tax=Smallanthus sonchifolius TaxID=185202 RepID=A0ACB9K649_9ASTR|nr:hypothetical protein L1987_01858 [Smallanthus sonchifolius]
MHVCYGPYLLGAFVAGQLLYNSVDKGVTTVTMGVTGIPIEGIGPCEGTMLKVKVRAILWDAVLKVMYGVEGPTGGMPRGFSTRAVVAGQLLYDSVDKGVMTVTMGVTGIPIEGTGHCEGTMLKVKVRAILWDVVLKVMYCVEGPSGGVPWGFSTSFDDVKLLQVKDRQCLRFRMLNDVMLCLK